MAPQASRPRQTHVIQLESHFSDGSREHWPKAPYEYRPDDDYYHRSLASQWMDSTGQAQKNTTYILSALPKDYAIYTKTRKNGTHIDRYLFGHPKGRFDSPIKFFVHFKHLMSGGQTECDCVNCKPTKTYISQRPVGQKSSGYKPPGYAPDAPGSVLMNVERNPAQKYIDLLYRDHYGKAQNSPLDFSYDDLIGWNYRLFNPHTEYKSPHHDCHSFEPRENEIILVYEGHSAVCLEEKAQYLKLFSNMTQQFCGWPKWEAGRVISTPEPGQIRLEDLASSALDGQKKLSKNICVEILPSDNVNSSLPRTLNVDIGHVRPFSMLRELHHGQDQSGWKDNILPTALMMSKLYLIEPCAFTRLLPTSDSLNAKFRCRGIWIGAEKIIEGDAVRLVPLNNGALIDHVLIVEEISYVYEHLESALPTGSIFLEGRCLTVTQPHPKSKPVVRSISTYEELAIQGLPKSMRGYTWYEVENPDSNRRFPPGSVVGRCYEREAMELLIYAADLNIGLDGVYQSRQRAMATGGNDQHGWVWAEHRFGTESHVRLNELRVGRSRALECNVALAGPNNFIGELDPQVKNPGRYDGDSLDGTSGGPLEKMTIISGSVVSPGKEDEADLFVRQALEGSFDGAEHVAKKLRI